MLYNFIQGSRILVLVLNEPVCEHLKISILIHTLTQHEASKSNSTVTLHLTYESININSFIPGKSCFILIGQLRCIIMREHYKGSY